MKHLSKSAYTILVLILLIIMLTTHKQIVLADTKEKQKITSTFEKEIEAFPESYHDSLRQLHLEYPKWKFVPVVTKLKWSDVVKQESKVGINTIYSGAPYGRKLNAPISYLSKERGAYSARNDTYRVCDGSYWFAANRQTISYYLDPRNFLTTRQIFQFQSLKYEITQMTKNVQLLLKNTFMKGNFTYGFGKAKRTKSYASTFMEAAKKYNVNAYFLASRAKHELGSSGSMAVSGRVPGYIGIYNFFNIGANDSSSGNAAITGLRFAKTRKGFLRPWTSPYKAILGGSQYIANEYIKYGQYTYYFQKFNVVYKDYLYNHQYLTNVQGPSVESLHFYETFKSMGILESAMTFYIPIYKDMPSKPCELPDGFGSMNNYIQGLQVYSNTNIKKNLLKSFSYKKQLYFISVKPGKYTISAKAKASSKYALVLGTGKKTVNVRENEYSTYKVTCKSQEGTKRNYYIVFFHGNGVKKAKASDPTVIGPEVQPIPTPDLTEQIIVGPNDALFPESSPTTATVQDPELPREPELPMPSVLEP